MLRSRRVLNAAASPASVAMWLAAAVVASAAAAALAMEEQDYHTFISTGSTTCFSCAMGTFSDVEGKEVCEA